MWRIHVIEWVKSDDIWDSITSLWQVLIILVKHFLINDAGNRYLDKIQETIVCDMEILRSTWGMSPTIMGFVELRSDMN